MDLPLKQQVFDFEYVTELGKKYDGQFTVLCSLNIGQKHALELEKTRLLGNFAEPTPGLEGLAIVLSNLRAKVVDAPNWWMQSSGGATVEDEDALVALYRKLQEVEQKWKNDLLDKAKKAQENQAPATAPAAASPQS
jgi:hypothetical protein